MEAASLVGFGLVILIASCFAILLKTLRIPLILAYLSAGFFVFFLGRIGDGFVDVELTFLPQVGLAFLLFLVGAELDFRELAGIGGKIGVAALVNMFVVGVIGFLVGNSVLGFDVFSSIFLGLILTFSSTILVVKFLADSKDLDSLHGRVSLGILLFQDLVAVVMLMFLSLPGGGSLGWIGSLGFKAVVLGLVVYGMGRFALPGLLSVVAHSSELLFLTTVSICFLVGGISSWLGFSFEIGAFLAGLAIGSSDYSVAVAAKVKPLRDLFVAVFFVDLGIKMAHSFGEINLWAVGAVLGIVMILKPLVYLFTLYALGFGRFTAFWVSLSLSQVSEFSLILMAAVASSGVLDEGMVAVIAISSIASMLISGVLIDRSKGVFRIVSPFLKFIRGARVENIDEGEGVGEGHVLLVGCDRSGGRILQYCRQSHRKMVVVDFNPAVVERLKKSGVAVVFGDIADEEVVEKAGMLGAKIIISTIRDLEDSLSILVHLRGGKGVRTILTANNEAEARYLKSRGASEVVIPQSLEGEYIVSMLKTGFGRVWPNPVGSWV